MFGSSTLLFRYFSRRAASLQLSSNVLTPINYLTTYRNSYIWPDKSESISSAIASETQKCFEEAICSKDHARGPEVLAAWSTQEQNKSAS